MGALTNRSRLASGSLTGFLPPAGSEAGRLDVQCERVGFSARSGVRLEVVVWQSEDERLGIRSSLMHAGVQLGKILSTPTFCSCVGRAGNFSQSPHVDYPEYCARVRPAFLSFNAAHDSKKISNPVQGWLPAHATSLVE